MRQPDPSISWPVIIQLHGDPELIFLADAQQFANNMALHRTHFQEQDRMIDSCGAIYILDADKAGWMNTGAVIALQEIEVILQQHLSDYGNVCVSKFHAHSIGEAIASVFTA